MGSDRAIRRDSSVLRRSKFSMLSANGAATHPTPELAVPDPIHVQPSKVERGLRRLRSGRGVARASDWPIRLVPEFGGEGGGHWARCRRVLRMGGRSDECVPYTHNYANRRQPASTNYYSMINEITNTTKPLRPPSPSLSSPPSYISASRGLGHYLLRFPPRVVLIIFLVVISLRCPPRVLLPGYYAPFVFLLT